MKILSDDFKIPKCPIELQTEADVNYAYGYDDGQQSILSQLKEVDIDELYDFIRHHYNSMASITIDQIPQFIEQYLKSLLAQIEKEVYDANKDS